MWCVCECVWGGIAQRGHDAHAQDLTPPPGVTVLQEIVRKEAIRQMKKWLAGQPATAAGAHPPRPPASTAAASAPAPGVRGAGAQSHALVAGLAAAGPAAGVDAAIKVSAPRFAGPRFFTGGAACVVTKGEAAAALAYGQGRVQPENLGPLSAGWWPLRL